jgi:hypothetical protein
VTTDDLAPFDPTHPSALAIYCSDGRFTAAVERLLSGLGHARLDVLCLPGGPALLTHWSASVADADMFRRSASFLVTAHQISDVVMLAHRGCGYYRQRYRTAAADEIAARQLTELRQAASWLRGAHAHLSVRTYFAEVANGRIEFQLVP